jgi:hypothetical protein
MAADGVQSTVSSKGVEKDLGERQCSGGDYSQSYFDVEILIS